MPLTLDDLRSLLPGHTSSAPSGPAPLPQDPLDAFPSELAEPKPKPRAETRPARPAAAKTAWPRLPAHAAVVLLSVLLALAAGAGWWWARGAAALDFPSVAAPALFAAVPPASPVPAAPEISLAEIAEPVPAATPRSATPRPPTGASRQAANGPEEASRGGRRRTAAAEGQAPPGPLRAAGSSPPAPKPAAATANQAGRMPADSLARYGDGNGGAEKQQEARLEKVDEVVLAQFDSPGAPGTGAARGDDAADPAADDPSADRVYSADDGGVEPPSPLRAWFYTERPAGLARTSLTEVELVVSAKGDVTSARVVTGPRTYADGMLLSALKGGKFSPALRDGRQVPYRMTVWIRVPER